MIASSKRKQIRELLKDYVPDKFLKENLNFHFAYVFERFPSFTQTFCVREVEEVMAQGVQPIIFSIRDTSKERGNEFQYPKDLRSKVITLPERENLRKIVRTLKDKKLLPRKAAHALRFWGDKPDKSRVYESAFIGLILEFFGVKHAHCHFAGLSARTCWLMKFFYGISYSFTGHANDIFCKENGEHVLSLKDLVKGANLVISVSDFSVARLKHQFRIYRERIKRVYNGIDIEPFENAANRRLSKVFTKDKKTKKNVKSNSNSKVIFSIGRLIEKKGFGDLITACALIRDKGLKNFRCVIAGGGPLKEALMEQIATLNLNKHVFLVGEAPQQFIIEQLSETEVFALPCKQEKGGGMDNLPTVIMEAMAAAVPCVSTNVAGVPEMIAGSVTGLLVNDNEPDRIADCLYQILTHKEEAEIMGRRGLLRAKRYFAKEITTRSLLCYIYAFGKAKMDLELLKKPIGFSLLKCYLAQKIRSFFYLFMKSAPRCDKQIYIRTDK